MTAAVARGRAERAFGPLLGLVVALAGVLRVLYIRIDDRLLPLGDGWSYHFEALRLADGLGYTSSAGDVGAPIAHHPPAWVTILGGVSWLGGRSLRWHQWVAVALGLGVVALAGLVGRRYFNARVGLLAAALAAVYPGFWLLEPNVLSEPLALVLVGVITLLFADLRDRPTPARCVLIGVVGGLLALTRSEQLMLLVIVAAPILLVAASLTWRQRVLRLVAMGVACVVVITPWTVYNATRFKEPVVLSTNGGTLLLIGNCSPGSFSGERLGFYDNVCNTRLAVQHPHFDRSQLDSLARSTAFSNIHRNVGRLPEAVPARLGRLLAVFRPSQTVDFVATWMGMDTNLIWAWVASFWVLLLASIAGGVVAFRRREYFWPLAAPFAIAVAVAAISYGEPRYHTPADLGIIVLAAVALDALLRALLRPRARRERLRVDESPGGSDRLPPVHVAG
jgi:4-amino-4-deoxy-L-arabinose transferase-like glycosyltransferase